MIKFFHTADTHFGVENYGKVDPSTGIHSRLIDFKNSLEQCIDLAIQEDIDFFLFCGDAYKTAYPTPTQQKLLTQLLFKLQKAKIPVVMIVGNHDNPLSFGKSTSLDLLDYVPLEGFHVISKPKILTLKTKNKSIQIVGIPWPTRTNLINQDKHRFKTSNEITKYLSEKVSMIIQGLADQLNPKIPAIMAGHLTVSNGIFSGSEKCAIFGNDPIILPSQLALPQFEYVALGHLHRYQNLNKNNKPAIVYSGSIERIDFGERKEEKGFCSIIIEKDNESKFKTSFEFRKLKTRPMVQIEVELPDNKNQTEQIIEEIKKHDIKDAIIKIIYHLPKENIDNVDLFAIQRECSAAMQIASITPIRKFAEKERRASLKVDMDIKTLLQKYLENKKDMQKKQDNLIEKALELYNKLNVLENEQ